MATTLLTILINCILIIVTLAVLYWVVKKAVRSGILEAWQEMKHPSQKVQYPVHIDEDHPDIPFPGADET